MYDARDFSNTRAQRARVVLDDLDVGKNLVKDKNGVFQQQSNSINRPGSTLVRAPFDHYQLGPDSKI